MKILITGAAGFLGRNLVDLFSQEKHQLVTIVRPTSDTTYLEEKKVCLIRGDLHDKKCIFEAAKSVDVIVHAAATLRGSWEEFHAINVEATQHLLDAAIENKVKRFVFISSVIVYDHGRAEAKTCFSEEMSYETQNQTYYCKTKIEAEKLVNEYHTQKNLQTTIIRPAAIYGTGGPLFLSRLGFAAGTNRYLIIGNGRLQLPLSHVEGIAEAVKLSIKEDTAIGKTYNVVEQEGVTQIEFFELLRKYVKPKFSTVRVPFAFMRFLSQTADKILALGGMTTPLPLSYMKLCATPFSYSSKKIIDELGWKPRTDFDQSLRDMMMWHKQARSSRRKLLNDDHRVPIKTDRKIRVGIVGCGAISGPHLETLKRLDAAAVVALCDASAEAREKMARQYGVLHTYENYKDMFEKEELDVVHVCTPGQSHAEISIEAAKRGCHIYVEKPFARDAAQAKKVVNAVNRHKVKMCVGHNHVFDKVMIDARNVLASGALGQIAYVESWYGTSYSSDTKSRYLTYEGRNNWAYDLPGSLYQNFISHPISLLLDIMGNASVQSVNTKYHRIVPHMPTDELRVTFENERMTGLLNMSMAVSPRYLFLNIYGTQGTLRVDFLNKTVFLDKPSAKLPRVISRSLSSLAYARIMLRAAVRNLFTGVIGKYNMYQGNETLIRLFYKCVIEDTPSPISAEEGLQSMEIMDEIWAKMAVENGFTASAYGANGRKNMPVRAASKPAVKKKPRKSTAR